MARNLSRLLVATLASTGCGQAESAGLGPVEAPSLASCGAGTALFSTMPVASSDLFGWVPLGQMGPPAHTFPTDHQYLYVNNPATPNTAPPVTVRSPGALHIVRVKRTQYQEAGRADYAIDFQSCREVLGYFGHLQTLDAAFAGRVGVFDRGCNSYSPSPGQTVTQCYSHDLDLSIGAGEPLGTAGGVPGVYGLDFGMYDSRIAPMTFSNPARWMASADGFDRYHVVAPSEYFDGPVRSEVAAKLGSFDGSVRRTVAPLGGTIGTDIPGTAQGVWFNDGQPTFPEGPHLTLAPDNVDPDQQVFSMGLSQPGLGAGTATFSPRGSGLVNRSFADVLPGGAVFCYEGVFGGVILLRLDSGTILTLEFRGDRAACASAVPWVFSAAAMAYRR